jgi:hypothetical protein
LKDLFNRTGIIALAIAAAVIAWGALHKDEPEPSRAAPKHGRRHETSVVDGGSPGKTAAHSDDGGFDGPREMR